MKKNKILVIYFSTIALSILLAYALFLVSPANVENQSVQTIVVEPGQGFRSVVEELRSAGVIRSRKAFLVYAALSGSAHRFKAGEYLIKPSLSTPEILRLLVSGPPPVLATIVEGATLKEIDELLTRLEVFPTGSLIKLKPSQFVAEYPFLKNARSLEGFLFPDTYHFTRKSEPIAVAKKFLDNFNKKAQQLLSTKNQLPITNYQLLILASLIEKEVSSHNDRLLVSGVLYNRLRISMPLQVDVELWTYQNYGLPPEPIANPGLSAIQAALNPASTKYLYYLSDPKTQKTIFSETLDEHNENKWQYLKK